MGPMVGWGRRTWFCHHGGCLVVREVRADFKRQMEANEDKKEVVTALGVLGFVTRGFVFGMIGVFFALAAVHARSSDAKGFAGAFRTLQNYSYGRIVLGMTSAGLIAFGLFEIRQGAYRRIRLPRRSKSITMSHLSGHQQRTERDISYHASLVFQFRDKNTPAFF
jgi:hypothetical protein